MRYFIYTALGAVLLAVPGAASPISFVTTEANAGFGAIENLYDSVTGLTQVNGNVAGASLTSSPSTNILGLTSSSVSTSLVSFNPQNGTTASGASSASANLATGILGVAASGSCSGGGVPADFCGEANSIAEMQDTLNFTNTTGQTQDITVAWTFDGTAPGSHRSDLLFLFCLQANTGCAGDFNSTPHVPLNTNEVFKFQQSTTGAGNTDTNTLPGVGWVSSSVTPGANATSETFQGVFAIPAGMSVDTLNAWMTADCGSGDSCDFSHTAALNISLVNGVSFTSASGVLLAQTGSSAPEPSSWAMMLMGGLGLAAGIVRRRR
jgi:PEP-CTERM motif-containing protein